jgi:hypothetical protein
VQFGVSDADRRRASILASIESVTTDRHANATGLGFARAHCTDKGSMRNLASSRDLAGKNKENGLIADNVASRGTISDEALRTASPFVG